MADIIVVKQNVAEKVSVNPAPVTVTGIILAPATNATLGGIIVGDNLTITGNGVLSAQPGGVTGFNNRTGNVSLTVNDVTTALTYTPLAPLGNVTHANSTLLIGSTGTEYIRGDVQSYISGAETHQQFQGFYSSGSIVEPAEYWAGRRAAETSNNAIGRANYFRAAGSSAHLISSYTSNRTGYVQVSTAAVGTISFLHASGGDNFPNTSHARVIACATTSPSGMITGNAVSSRLSVTGSNGVLNLEVTSNGPYAQSRFYGTGNATILYDSNSILTQGYADTRYLVKANSTGTDSLFDTVNGIAYSLLDTQYGPATGGIGIVPNDSGGIGISARLVSDNTTATIFEVSPTEWAAGVQGDGGANLSYLVLTKNDLNYSQQFGVKQWGDDSLLTRIYADTRYSAANHTHAIANITGLQTALDDKLPSANFTYANITGTPAAYTLPTANTTTLGGVKVDGSSVTISNGTISVSTSYAGLGTNTFTDSQNLQDNELIRAKIRDYSETVSSPTISSGTLVLNLETSNIFTVSLNAAITTLTISNPPVSGSGGSFTLILTADGTARAVTWPASIKWAGGTAPTLTSTSGKIDTFSFFTFDGGTTWQGYIGGQNF